MITDWNVKLNIPGENEKSLAVIITIFGLVSYLPTMPSNILRGFET